MWQLYGKNMLLFTFNMSVSNAQFFFCQIYVCNVLAFCLSQKL